LCEFIDSVPDLSGKSTIISEKLQKTQLMPKHFFNIRKSTHKIIVARKQHFFLIMLLACNNYINPKTPRK